MDFLCWAIFLAPLITVVLRRWTYTAHARLEPSARYLLGIVLWLRDGKLGDV